MAQPLPSRTSEMYQEGTLHEHEGHHHHTHGRTDPTVLTSDRGIWAVKWSFLGLMATALAQVVAVLLSGSVALLADTLHNFGDAFTVVPLWVAFALSQRRPNRRFTYGYGRVEDLAGIAIVFTILLSGLAIGYESVQRLLNPQPVQNLWIVAMASIIGFLGNEAVAQFRLKVGREIESAALVADGYHARADGLTSLAVLAGAAGVWLGFPLADPLVGLLITFLILRIVWESAAEVFTRVLDGVDPRVVEQIEYTVAGTPGVRRVGEVRARWIGHRLHAEINLAVHRELSTAKSHALALEVRHRLLHDLSYLSNAIIHVDPSDACGEEHHGTEAHVHDDLPPHSH